MTFAKKMAILPMMLILGLFALFMISEYFTGQNKVYLTQIETGFVPGLEWAYRMELRLIELDRTIRDAVSAQDEDELRKAETLAQELQEFLASGQTLPIITPEEYGELSSNVAQYYAQVMKVSDAMIRGESVSEEMLAQMQQMTALYHSIHAQTQEEIEEAKTSVAAMFLENQRNNNKSRAIMAATIAVFGAACLLFVIFAMLSVTRPLKKVIAVANELARGNADVSIDVHSKDEIGRMAEVFRGLININQDLAKAATAIGNGDYSVPVVTRSKYDMLGNALSLMKNNLMAKVEEIEHQSWLKTGLTDLNERLRGEKSVAELAREVITYLAAYLDAQIGAICVFDATSETLKLVGSYAYAERKGVRNEFRLGEGLIGQAALEKQAIVFHHVPDDYIKITSELGECSPQYILVHPFLYEHNLKGVIELGAVRKFSAQHLEFLTSASESIAIAFHSAEARIKMRALLEETQQQSAILLQQQEELKRANEELEEQTRSLRISEEKLQYQQEELRQTNEELAEQTKMLEQQQRELREKNIDLEHASQIIEEKAKDLELSSKYKSEFLSNMSHELRTPLNSMLILSRLLYENKEQNLSEKQIEYARTINASGTELLTLINEILDLSKIESGKMAVNIEEMNLRGLSAYIEQHFSHIAQERSLFLKVEVADDAPEAIATDRQRVEQILKNLLSNAMKFTHEGGITVRIGRPASATALKNGRDPRSMVALAVADTGIGIPADKQRLIFEAFQQADGTTSRKYGGTGLGLSITRELAKLLGGEIRLESETGKGSVFTLYLPERLTQASSPSPPPQKDQQAAQAAVAPAAPKPPQMTLNEIRDDRHELEPTDHSLLLIIEDDAKFAKILFDMARERGFQGLIAGDGASGLQLADQYHPNAIILDIGLPDMDGWAVMEKLKANPETRPIPVHFISGQDASLEAMKMGAIGYVTKPVTLQNLDDVFHKIRDMLTHTEKALLIVEDNETMRTSLCELLSGSDVQITAVASGEEAYRLLQSASFDCMVLDLGLADISGFDLLEKIKRDTRLMALPIIVYTGKELTKDEELRLQKHAERIIIKGVKSPERLLDEVTLFLHRLQSNLPQQAQKKARMLHDKEGVFAGKIILVVDDDMRNVFALSSVLEGKGMDVLVAENGKEALEQLDEHPEADLVLMDIMMPEMNGYETMQRIRSQARFEKLPIIALTANAMKGDRQKAIDAGANDYLSKPIDIDKLLSLLRVWLY